MINLEIVKKTNKKGIKVTTTIDLETYDYIKQQNIDLRLLIQEATAEIKRNTLKVPNTNE